MTNKKRLIITLCCMFLVVVVGVVGIFAASTKSFSISTSATYSALQIGGTCTVTISGGATANNGGTACTNSIGTKTYNSTTTAADNALSVNGGNRYFSYNADVTDGNVITITVVNTVSAISSGASKVKYTVAITPSSSPSNVTIKTTNTLKVGSDNTVDLDSGTSTAFTSGDNHVYTTTSTATITDFAYSVTQFNFKVVVTIEAVV